MQKFAPITKFSTDDAGNVLVEGVVSSEAEDFDGEIITADAMRQAIPNYMRFANIREMHGPSAAGVALSIGVDDQGFTRITAKIVDRDAIAKIRESVYKGFSIGARLLARVGKTITQIELVEISLVDRPANPDAVFQLAKIAADGENELTKTTKAAADQPAEAAPEPSLSDVMTALVSISEKLDQLLATMVEEAIAPDRPAEPAKKSAKTVAPNNGLDAELQKIRDELALLKSTTPAGAAAVAMALPAEPAAPDLSGLTPEQRALLAIRSQFQPT